MSLNLATLLRESARKHPNKKATVINDVELSYGMVHGFAQRFAGALRKAMEADRRSGANIFYVDGDRSVMQVLRLLRGGGCVAVASDGMLADDFLEVPFLDGLLRVPCGWARLAAITHADIMIVMDRDIVDSHGTLTFENCVRCEDRSTAAVREALALLFSSTNVEQVLGVTDVRNLASVRLLERAGFKHRETVEAIFRGEPCSEATYVLQRNDG